MRKRDTSGRSALKSTVLAGLLISTALTLSACETVEEGIRDADEALTDFFGDDDTTTAQTDPATVPGEEVYQRGLSARASGDDQAALADLEEAGDLGHPAAAYEAALAHMEGLGTAKDLDQAAQWMNKATELGEPRALYLAGVNHAAGNGVVQNDTQAALYFGEAAVQGHAGAQYQLAGAFAEGRGVAKDLAWAMRWYGKAAAQGLPNAQLAFGVLLAAGKPYPKNPAAGYRWLLLAAAQGNAEAEKAVAALEKQLDAGERDRAQAWAQAFRPIPSSVDFADRPTVMYVQYRLNGLGYQAGPVDGLSGPRTSVAVDRYRSARSLGGEDGITVELVEALFNDTQGAS